MSKSKIEIPFTPRAGVYGNPEVSKAYKELYQAVHDFMADVNQDTSQGSLSLGGVASIARARASALVSKSKVLEGMVKAVCIGRK